MKAISVLGCTGSIGVNTLDIVAKNPGRFSIVGLAAGRNLEVLKPQILQFKPKIVSLAREEDAKALRDWAKQQSALPAMKIVAGEAGACEVACADGVQMVIAAMVGAVGLAPTLAAVQKGIDVGLANKETMVVAGALMNAAAQRTGAKILPVDSEHNALFQAMEGQNKSAIRRLILTASGGPFRNASIQDLKSVTPQQALKHPNWDMGAKITIDSATMMNKGLEVIEAHFLFNMPIEKIDILVHPQSIVHSMVEYCDGSVIAQLGIPDMRIPIGYALAYPERLPNDLPRLDLLKAKTLEFYPPDRERFPAIRLAYEALKMGGTMPTVLNAANEVAIPHFLEGRIGFLQIPQSVERVMEAHSKDGFGQGTSLDELIQVDAWARQRCEAFIQCQ